MRLRFAKCLAAVPLILVVSTASAVPVDRGLSMVVDVSGSVSTDEYNLQMGGYADAFRDPGIQSNILGGTNGAIAVNTVFFTSFALSTTLDDFTLLDSPTAIDNYANTLDTFGRPGSGGTNVAAGMEKSIDLLEGTTFTDNFSTSTRIVDVSGDGTGGTGSSSAVQRDRAESLGITVNGIAIGSTSVETAYNNSVKTSDGFVEFASDFEDFDRAVRTKLAIETGGEVTVPAPGTLALFGVGLLGLGLRRLMG